MIGEAPRRCGSLSGRLKGADKETYYNLAFGTCHIITPLFFSTADSVFLSTSFFSLTHFASFSPLAILCIRFVRACSLDL